MRTPNRYLDPAALAKLANMELRARTIVEGFFSGQHRSPFRGASVEFADHREYTPGDEIRHLDWKVFARSDRYYVKEYDAETNLLVNLVLDASASMAYSSNGLTKLQYASYLTAALAYMAVQQRDMAGLVVFDEAVRRRLSPGASPSHLAALLEALESTQAGGQTNLSATLEALALSMRRRGLVILISDLYDEPERVLRGLGHFRHRGHDVAVFHVLDPGEQELPERGPVLLEDMETGERLATDADEVRGAYRREVSRFIGAYRQGCRERFIDYLCADTATPFEQVLASFLGRRAVVRR
ncbi:MAG: DUF58 domain-containing protein [Armatimonadota bacterium]